MWVLRCPWWVTWVAVVCCCIIARVSSWKHASQADGEILDVKACEDILSFDNVDVYQPLTLNYPTFKKWPELEKIQKAVFLIDRAHLVNVRREFVSLRDDIPEIPATTTVVEAHSPTLDETLQESPSFVAVPLDTEESTSATTSTTASATTATVTPTATTSAHDNDVGVTLNTLLTRWSEFTPPKTIYSLFQDCDTDLDLSLHWIEYLLCRNQYNQYGAPFDVSEFDYIENIVLHDFQQRLLDPTDPMTLALLARDEL